MAFTKLTCNTFNPQPKPEKVVKQKKAYKFVKKPTGEKIVFEMILAERSNVSQISNTPIPNPVPSNFMHIIPKGQNKYPQFKLLKENIWLATEDEHFLWDNQRHLCTGVEWIKVFALEKVLKAKYALLYPAK